MTITSIAFTKLFADSSQVKEEKAIKNKTIKSALVPSSNILIIQVYF